MNSWSRQLRRATQASRAWHSTFGQNEKLSEPLDALHGVRLRHRRLSLGLTLLFLSVWLLWSFAWLLAYPLTEGSTEDSWVWYVWVSQVILIGFCLLLPLHALSMERLEKQSRREFTAALTTPPAGLPVVSKDQGRL